MGPRDASDRASGQVRVLGLVEGDPRTALSGITLRIFDALSHHVTVAGILDYGAHGLTRLALGAGTFRPNRAAWRGRFHTSPLAHRVLSRRMAALADDAQGFDVALQIHGWAHRQPRPFAIYVDQTRLMADRGWPDWLPLPAPEREQILDAERQMYEEAFHIFVMGDPAERSLIDEYGVLPERISVVGGGLNFDSFPEPSAPSKEPAILFVGREFERKGGEVLVEAFAAVRQAVPRATLHIVGARPRVSAPGVTVHGKLADRSELIRLYRRSRAFCLPSLYEPWGFVLTEAMALGTPCVGTSVQSIPHLLDGGRAGLLVPPGDPEALADALIRLLQDDSLASELSRRGRERVEQGFTWDHVARRMAPVLAQAR